MKGKKLGKQSQHVRVLSTKKGKKKVMINPGHRRVKARKQEVLSMLPDELVPGVKYCSSGVKHPRCIYLKGYPIKKKIYIKGSVFDDGS